MNCVNSFLGICLVPVSTTASIFGFKDFITALALLVVIYTTSDIRYRFRVVVSPTQLLTISYVFIVLIGFGTLATDIWINEKWLVPDNLLTAATWQGAYAALFLGLVITWMWYAFIRPPIFGRNNCRKYAQELYRIVLKGSETELPIIAHELASSAKPLITFAAGLNKAKLDEEGRPKPCAESYARDMLLLIANRKLCRHLVASSPLTAIGFLDAVVEFEAYHVPIGPFVRNISTEAILNKDSSLYHEDGGYSSGLLGYIKPFSHALYGNYKLVEALEHDSPFDIHYESILSWDADQFQTYCRAAHITFKSFLAGNHWVSNSYVLTRALGNIQEVVSDAIFDIKSLDNHIGDSWVRLRVGVEFIVNCINEIDSMNPAPDARTLRLRQETRYRTRYEDFYDRLAGAIFKIIDSAGYIQGPPEKAWTIHHNSIWISFFGIGKEGKAWKIIQFKLKRLLYDEIQGRPNFGTARVLGVCLNVMGLKVGKRSGFIRDYADLQAVVLAWTKKNYLRMREENTEIADACLLGGITFDAEHGRLVKTYAKLLNQEPHQEFLLLQPPDLPIS